MKHWYLNRSPKVRLLISWIFNCIMWLILEWLIGLVWQTEEVITVKGKLFKALFMGSWWTLFMNWRLVKLSFSKQKSSHGTN